MFSYSTRNPTICFYMPEAESVSLVIDGWYESQPMHKNEKGYWCLKLHQSIEDLQNLEYHFNIVHDGHVISAADPFAHRIRRQGHWLKSYFDDLHYRWQNPDFNTPPLNEIVIYETHLPALSRHSSSGVIPPHRGTYKGVQSPIVLDHLQSLQVAIEFLPLHASDKLLGQDWGYFTTSFFAMSDCYSTRKKEVNKEVMELVDTMHGHGVPVILDVVFNHGAETWAKAWGEDVVYRKHANGDFCHGSGCGPTVRTENPLIREIMIETLLHLVKYYHFDGFRFDLGALHDKQTMLEIDRRLPSHIYLIAEPWALGGTQWGKGDLAHDFAATRWAVWNDDFRESAKTFLLGNGDHHNRDRLMQAITGNHIHQGGWTLKPQQCVNYLTSHDGKTLADYVGNNKKRVFLGVLILLTSQGVPMLGEGTEFLFSKQGHDNSYNRPDLNQINWYKAQYHLGLVKAVAGLIALRKRLPHFHYTSHLRYRSDSRAFWDIDWIYPTGYPHNDNVNAIGYVLKRPPAWYRWRRMRDSIIVLLNGSHDGAEFHLPKGKWKVLVDGNGIVANFRGIEKVPLAQNNYYVHPGTGVMLGQ